MPCWVQFGIDLVFYPPEDGKVTLEAHDNVLGKVSYKVTTGTTTYTLWVEYATQEDFERDQEKGFSDVQEETEKWLEEHTPNWLLDTEYTFDALEETDEEPPRVNVKIHSHDDDDVETPDVTSKLENISITVSVDDETETTSTEPTD
jgi:hypothetical protein